MRSEKGGVFGLENDLELDVLVARIECESWRDALASYAVRKDAERLQGARRRFEQAKETLRRANHGAHVACVVVPLRPDQIRTAPPHESAAAA